METMWKQEIFYTKFYVGLNSLQNNKPGSNQFLVLLTFNYFKNVFIFVNFLFLDFIPCTSVNIFPISITQGFCF